MGKYIRKKHPFNCKNCGTEFLAYKKGKATKKYCSRKCSDEVLFQDTRKIFQCEYCGTDVQRTKGNVKNRVFCSKECTDLARKEFMKREKIRLTKICKFCKQDFTIYPFEEKKRKFCSRQCSADYNSKESKVKMSCTNCKQEFQRNKSRIRSENNFCSNKCVNEWIILSGVNSGENHHFYTGNNPHSYGSSWRRARYLTKNRDKHICQNCGMNEEQSKELFNEELSVHHKIPFVFWSNHKDANQLDNLITLCKSCHLQEHSGDLHPSNYDTDKFGTL